MKVLCQRRGFTLIELVVVLVIIGILAAILWPVLHRAREIPHGHHSCQSNLKQIGLGFMQYAQDYDERWPRIAAFSVSSSTTPFAKPYGWADALQPYVKNTNIFQCPSEENFKAGTEATRTGFTDYYYNTNISGVASKYFVRPKNTILSGDGNDGTDGADARYNRNSLPQNWRTDANSPVRRHLDGSIYLFADGHTKWFKPNAIQNAARPAAGKPTFAIR